MVVSLTNSGAQCSLWIGKTPPYQEHRLGLIGHYFASDATAGAALLRAACAELQRQRCTLAVGPMDGSTWQRYRFITERGGEPVFFLEPDNRDDWPLHFTSQGFVPLARYCSAITDRIQVNEPRIEHLAASLFSQGFSIRAIASDRFEEELSGIFTLALASFAGNFLYTPISEDEFLSQYRGIRTFIRPELTLIAENRGEVAGFLFALPDPNRTDTFIVKTLAVHPRFRGRGLGSVLLLHVNRVACGLGFRRSIHALMHEENVSTHISERQAVVFRRYTLFARPLA